MSTHRHPGPRSTKNKKQPLKNHPTPHESLAEIEFANDYYDFSVLSLREQYHRYYLPAPIFCGSGYKNSVSQKHTSSEYEDAVEVLLDKELPIKQMRQKVGELKQALFKKYCFKDTKRSRSTQHPQQKKINKYLPYLKVNGAFICTMRSLSKLYAYSSSIRDYSKISLRINQYVEVIITLNNNLNSMHAQTELMQDIFYTMYCRDGEAYHIDPAREIDYSDEEDEKISHYIRAFLPMRNHFCPYEPPFRGKDLPTRFLDYTKAIIITTKNPALMKKKVRALRKILHRSYCSSSFRTHFLVLDKLW